MSRIGNYTAEIKITPCEVDKDQEVKCSFCNWNGKASKLILKEGDPLKIEFAKCPSCNEQNYFQFIHTLQFKI